MFYLLVLVESYFFNDHHHHHLSLPYLSPFLLHPPNPPPKKNTQQKHKKQTKQQRQPLLDRTENGEVHFKPSQRPDRGLARRTSRARRCDVCQPIFARFAGRDSVVNVRCTRSVVRSPCAFFSTVDTHSHKREKKRSRGRWSNQSSQFFSLLRTARASKRRRSDSAVVAEGLDREFEVVHMEV